MRTRRLMAILAHPDDESMALGGTLAKYAAEGVETYLVCATRGSAGRYGAERGKISPETLSHIRTAELERASEVLGLTETHFLGYTDGQVDQVDQDVAMRRLVELIRRIRPQVVVTFGPDGLYGHPDHIAISQLATAAVAAADDPDYRTGTGEGHAAHGVSKLYYPAWSAPTWDAYQAALKPLVMTVDGVKRGATAWPDWMITTVIDTSDYAEVAARAVACHHSQVMNYTRFNAQPLEKRANLWRKQEFYRAISTVSCGRGRETDLFAGVREIRVAA